MFLIVIFAISGIGAIYYSQGYRLDVTTWKVSKIGALYIESYQKPIEIYLNGTFYKDKSGILKKGTFIASILPKKYRLSIQKEGYISYEKNITILPSQVTRFFNIILVPKEIPAEKSFEEKQGQEIILTAKDGTVLTQDSEKKITTKHTFKPQETSIDIGKKVATLTKEKFSSFSLNEENSNEIVAIGTKNISVFNIEKETSQQIFSGKKLFAKVVHTDVIVLHTTTYATATSTKSTKQKGEEKTMLSIIPISGNAPQTELSPLASTSVVDVDAWGDEIGFLLSDGTLVMYNKAEKTTQTISTQVTKFAFSPDGKKLLYQEKDGKILVYFIEGEVEILDAQKKETLRLQIVDASNIQEIWWYTDSFHILLKYPEKIVLAEVTKSEPNNHFTVYNNSFLDASYNRFTNDIVTTHAQDIISFQNLDFEKTQ